MAEEYCTTSTTLGAITCTLDPTPVVVEVAKPKAEPISDDEELIIVNEGIPPEKDQILVDDQVYNVYGAMSVQNDGRSIIVKPGGQRGASTNPQSSDQTCKC